MAAMNDMDLIQEAAEEAGLQCETGDNGELKPVIKTPQEATRLIEAICGSRNHDPYPELSL